MEVTALPPDMGTLEKEGSCISELILFFAFKLPFGQTWERAREAESLNTALMDQSPSTQSGRHGE